MPVAVSETLLAAALGDGALDEGANVGGFSLVEGLARNAFAEGELLTAGREGSPRLTRGEALALAVWVGVATGAGTAAVYSGCGQMATATAEATTPMKAIGATTRPTRTASGGRSARRGRERANPNHSPEYIRPRSNRYLRGSLGNNDHEFIFGGPKSGLMWRRSHPVLHRPREPGRSNRDRLDAHRHAGATRPESMWLIDVDRVRGACLTRGCNSAGLGRAGCACSRTRSGCGRPRTATADPPRGRRRPEDPT
jgi:hypothetical protein